jgi:dTDP-4-dehydrorhamnose reductase
MVFGAGGQVGRAVRATAPADVRLEARDSTAVDIRDGEAVREAVANAGARVIVNCAAWTDVDGAEAHAAEARRVNGEALEGLGRSATELGARVIHLSSDYVFDGAGGAPYSTEASPNPLSAYAASKELGERLLLSTCPQAVVLRTGWVHSGNAKSFVSTAVRVLRDGRSMEVVDDQIGTPTRAAHLARAIWAIALRPEVRGILHFTDAGVASWYDVAECVLGALRDARRAPEGATVTPVPTGRVPRPARRPACAVLDKHASWGAIGWTPPHWRVGVIESTREVLDA